MDKILFYDELKWLNDFTNKFIEENNCTEEQSEKVIHLAYEKFMESFLEDKKKFIDDNIEQWHLYYLEKEMENLEHIENIWGKGFALYSSYIESCMHFSDEYLKYIEEIKRFDNNQKGMQVFTVLRYLNGRAIQVAKEILVLMKNGYADAAYARHRTLYELAIISTFIAMKNNDNLAQEFINYKGSQYDWAKSYISEKNKTKKITIKTIAEECGNISVKHWKPEYDLSNMLVHASPRGTFSRIAIKGSMKKILIGPSDYGLLKPAINSLETIYRVNYMYFSWDNCGLALLWANILKELKEKAYKQFCEIDKNSFKN